MGSLQPKAEGATAAEYTMLILHFNFSSNSNALAVSQTWGDLLPTCFAGNM
jgi:hypothetical protein